MDPASTVAAAAPERTWRRQMAARSPVARALGRFARSPILRYLGPGFIVTVGFIDPGNWATNIAGGSEFGYTLLWVITLSTAMLILLQSMSARLGVVTGHSLAANIRSRAPRWVSHSLGATVIVACAATDVAEYLGAALGFHLLFGLPLWLGAIVTVAIVVTAILGQRYHSLERMILVFLAVIAGCYLIELWIVKPNWGTLAPCVVTPRIDSRSILVAMGMLGAVVMPHNVFLHSNVIQSREWGDDDASKRRLIRFELVDTIVAMGMGWVVNSSMIIVAAAVFFQHGTVVRSIEEASRTLQPLAGPLAQVLFGVALLFAGVGSSITSSLAEANVVCGFLGKPEDTHSRFYRLGLVVTSVPAMVVIAAGFDSYKTLILSQVALSLQLPFTIIPLLILARSRKVMGSFRSGPGEFLLAVIVAGAVMVLNALLLYQTFGGTFDFG
ncbi:MAG TPA: Nramp family divalent metal transporter [Armatimonadota bacterium]|nr:Nramp family divalent metal transporter [Armatimonadota bacterium]HQK93200.1 Nramp family divalent metal transporter [Armatimonadota bacterium]